jgi:hypothetical protein
MKQKARVVKVVKLFLQQQQRQWQKINAAVGPVRADKIEREKSVSELLPQLSLKLSAMITIVWLQFMPLPAKAAMPGSSVNVYFLCSNPLSHYVRLNHAVVNWFGKPSSSMARIY